MKKTIKLIGVIAMVAVIGFSMAACGGNSDPGDKGPGYVSTPIAQAVTYRGTTTGGSIYTLVITENTARYVAQSGDSYVLTITVSGTTKTSSGTVTTAGNTLTLTPSGSTTTFTVTISESGITNMTGTITLDGGTTETAPTQITATPIPPEELSVVERWWSWAHETATATINHSVATDGVCTIIVGGVAQVNDETDDWGKWKARAGYTYTTTTDTAYEYKFEAWTQSGTRDLWLGYYEENEAGHLGFGFDITAQRKTYTLIGRSIPKGATRSLEFNSADQLGTFYVKIISVTPVIDADRWSHWTYETNATINHSVGNDGVCTITISGTAEQPDDSWKATAQYTYTATANTPYEYIFEAWTEAEPRNDVWVGYYEDNGTGHLGEGIDITTQRETYTIFGESLPKGGERSLAFPCGKQTGKLFVKIISIAPYTP